MSDGVTLETARTVCAQYGARLVTVSGLDGRTDLLDQVREERRSGCREEERGGLGYWLRSEEEERCQVWMADSDLLSVPGQFTVTSVPCNLTNLNICRVQSPPFWRVLDVQMCLGLVGLGHIWIIVDRKKVRIISRYFVTFLVLG